MLDAIRRFLGLPVRTPEKPWYFEYRKSWSGFDQYGAKWSVCGYWATKEEAEIALIVALRILYPRLWRYKSGQYVHRFSSGGCTVLAHTSNWDKR